MIHIILFLTELFPFVPIFYSLVESKYHLQLGYIYYFLFHFEAFVLVSMVRFLCISFYASVCVWILFFFSFFPFFAVCILMGKFGCWLLCKFIGRKIRVKTIDLRTLQPPTSSPFSWRDSRWLRSFQAAMLLIHFKLIDVLGRPTNLSSHTRTHTHTHKRKRKFQLDNTISIQWRNNVDERECD